MARDSDSDTDGDDAEQYELVASSVPSYVEEAPQIAQLLSSARASGVMDAPAYEQLLKWLQKYQELPVVLDPHLSDWVTTLCAAVREHSSKRHEVDVFLSIVYVLCKTRGYKTIVRFMPHGVTDVEFVLSQLELRQRTAAESSSSCADLPAAQQCALDAFEGVWWQARYALLVWLSIVVLVPFGFEAIDVDAASATHADASSPAMPRIVHRMVASCKLHLGDTGRTREGASVALSRLLTRPDIVKTVFPLVVDEFVQTLSRGGVDVFRTCGYLQTLVEALKAGARSDLLPMLARIPPRVFTPAASMPLVTRKLCVKLAERVAMCYLPMRVAKWRYQRGIRSLIDNLRGTGLAAAAASNAAAGADQAPRTFAIVGGGQPVSHADSASRGQSSPANGQDDGGVDDDDDDVDVPEGIDDVIDVLLRSLGDQDSVIRWAAAKALGRITDRLPLALVDDVVAGVCDLFGSASDDASWHGACLVFAEMARRGMQLSALRAYEPALRVHAKVFCCLLGSATSYRQLVVRALRYDELRGQVSVGSHVRDAACYVCWAFARAYDRDVMRPFFEVLASNLVVLCVYDRETNCRRAAAAAFQENVGRQGQFPHGIEIVTAADFFSVGNRARAFLHIAPQIAAFDEYRSVLVSDLLDNKCRHWDRAVRELAADALGKLVPCMPAFVVDTALPLVVSRCMDDDPRVRHGYIVAAAALLRALGEHHGALDGGILPDALRDELCGVAPRLEHEKMFRGRGGELVRFASCALIASIATTRLRASEAVLRATLTVLDGCLRTNSDFVQGAAGRALQPFLVHFGDRISAEVNAWLDGLLRELSTPSAEAHIVTRGACTALGKLSPAIVLARVDVLVKTLVQRVHVPAAEDMRDAETRRNAVLSLCDVVAQVAAASPARCEATLLSTLFDTLLDVAMHDYCIDNRGDVGSWIREVTMAQFDRMLTVAQQTTGVPEATTMRVLAALVQQVCEKIDHVRAVAGAALRAVVHEHEPALAGIPASMRTIVPADAKFNWASASDSYPIMVQFLGDDAFAKFAVKGLVVAVGGLTESLVRASSAALVAWLRAAGSGRVSALLAMLVSLVYPEGGPAASGAAESAAAEAERLCAPVLKVAELIVRQGLADGDAAACEQLMTLVNVVAKSHPSSADVPKIVGGVEFLCSVLGLDGTALRARALTVAMLFLGHRFPKVRRVAAELLASTLLTLGDSLGSGVDTGAALGVLRASKWDGAIADVRAARARLCKILGVSEPMSKSAAKLTADKADTATDEPARVPASAAAPAASVAEPTFNLAAQGAIVPPAEVVPQPQQQQQHQQLEVSETAAAAMTAPTLRPSNFVAADDVDEL